MKRIIVIGAGIIGAATAYYLQAEGAQVTIIDDGHGSATTASFGWVNASFFANEDHFNLRMEGINAYLRLSSALEIPVGWTGCLCWENAGQALDDQQQELKDLGYDVQELDARSFAVLEPEVADPPERCLLFPGEAAVESRELAGCLIAAAINLGAHIITGTAVNGFIFSGERIAGVETSSGNFTADETLIAAGTETEKLAALVDVNVPMLDRPAVVIKTRPVKPIINHILVSGIGEVRQLPDGSILMPASVGHQGDSASEIERPTNVIADRAMARLRGLLPAGNLELAQIFVASRPYPADGLPVAGSVKPGLYVATMHSGITLGALMGELIAVEILDGTTKDTGKWLESYRPDRFSI